MGFIISRLAARPVRYGLCALTSFLRIEPYCAKPFSSFSLSEILTPDSASALCGRDCLKLSFSRFGALTAAFFFFTLQEITSQQGRMRCILRSDMFTVYCPKTISQVE